jgi:hypothetical protein
MKSKIQLWILLAAVLILLPASLSAQATGVVVGTVQDSSGAVVPAAQVRAVNQLTGVASTTSTDGAGRFSFPRLPVGQYRIEATIEGFRQSLSEAFRLEADQSREVTVSLEVGSTTETVTVTGAVAAVDTVSATVREVVDEKRITELPLNGRNPLQLVVLTPGAVSAPGGGSLNRNEAIAVNGGRGTGTNYLLDGGDNNDPQQNVGAVQPNPDALEEFSIQTNNFSAEFGRNSGAVSERSRAFPARSRWAEPPTNLRAAVGSSTGTRARRRPA